MTASNQTMQHVYGEKLRQLQAENDALKRTLEGVRGLVNNTLPIDDKLSVLHKIKLLVK